MVMPVIVNMPVIVGMIVIVGMVVSVPVVVVMVMVMAVIVVVRVFVVLVNVSHGACLAPKGDGADGSHYDQGDPAGQHRDEEKRREDVSKPAVQVHHQAHAAEGAAGGDGAKLVEVIRAAVRMVVTVIVSHE
jgi:hypothetical protein